MLTLKSAAVSPIDISWWYRLGNSEHAEVAISTLLSYCLLIGFIGSYHYPILPPRDVGDIGVKAAESPGLPVKCSPTSRDLDTYTRKYASAITIFKQQTCIYLMKGHLMVCGRTMFEQWITLCSYKMVVLLTLSLALLQLQAGHHHTEKKQLSASHCFGHTEVHIVFSGHINIYTSGSQFFFTTC